MARERAGIPGSRGCQRTLAITLRTALALSVLSACEPGPSGSSSEDEPLLVMAAASLGNAMPALVERFEADTGLSVDLVLGATGTLAAQMENGAPADLFFAADRRTVERLVESGTIRGESVRDYAAGELVLVWRQGVAAPTSLAGLVDARFEIVSIANPESAPYGAAAKQALLSTHLWDELSPRVVMGENVAQTYQLVRTGNADAALVARSIIEATVPLLAIDPAAYAPLLHAAGILEEGDAVRAQRFLVFVLSDDGQKILASYGFGPAPRDP